MPDRIAANSTILSVWNKLTYSRDYGTGVLQKLRTCRNEHGNSQVKIGVTGSGQKPCYRITYSKPGSDAEMIYGSYWDNHDPLESEFVLTQNWSSELIPFEELESFLKEKYPVRKKQGSP